MTEPINIRSYEHLTYGEKFTNPHVYISSETINGNNYFVFRNRWSPLLTGKKLDKLARVLRICVFSIIKIFMNFSFIFLSYRTSLHYATGPFPFNREFLLLPIVSLLLYCNRARGCLKVRTPVMFRPIKFANSNVEKKI